MSNDHSPGEHWDYRSGSYKRDLLRRMEVWADRNPEKMTPAKWDEFSVMQAAVDYAMEVTLAYMQLTGDEFIYDDLTWYAKPAGLDEGVLIMALERLYHSGQITHDYAGPSNVGTWHHWYKVK